MTKALHYSCIIIKNITREVYLVFENLLRQRFCCLRYFNSWCFKNTAVRFLAHKNSTILAISPKNDLVSVQPSQVSTTTKFNK